MTDQDTEVRASSESNVLRRVLLVAVALVSLVVAWWIGAAVIPRWWAQRISDLIDGRIVFGNLLGFSVGALFTLLPLLVLWLGWRFRGGWRRAIVFVVLAVVAASPNLATLGIVVGNGGAAHAGERILDVDGPGFRGGSLVGAVVGAIAGLSLILLNRSRKRNKRKAKALQAELGGRS